MRDVFCALERTVAYFHTSSLAIPFYKTEFRERRILREEG
jgi:hypothetical protein